ncbi:MAG: hypothetical protein JWR56_2617 [Massilia sp.]|nr:hypothetical protein [Massilia sp.]
MFKKKIAIGLLGISIAAAFAAPAFAQSEATGKPTATVSSGALSKGDQKILSDIAVANMAEVNAGKIAVGKTQNADVKAFAQKMIDDHSKALDDVKALAQNKGVTLPSDVDAPHKAMAAKLDKLSGAAFDKAYLANAGVADHTKVHTKLKSFATRAKDPDVKALAEKLLPTVDQHLQLAKEIDAKLATAK